MFTVDNGEELGGKSWLKIQELRKLLKGFGAGLIQNHKRHCEDRLLDETLGYMYYYNNAREHSSLKYQTSFECLKQQTPEVYDTIRFVQLFILEDVSVKLGPWSRYHVLAQNRLENEKD